MKMVSFTESEDLLQLYAIDKESLEHRLWVQFDPKLLEVDLLIS